MYASPYNYLIELHYISRYEVLLLSAGWEGRNLYDPTKKLC